MVGLPINMRHLDFAIIAVITALAPSLACTSSDPIAAGVDKVIDRAAYVVGEIESHNSGISEEHRQEKYRKMVASAFSFYRGSNHLYWGDFAGDIRLRQFGSERTRIWLQADLHAHNFGAYDNDRGTIVYDLNDFDEVVIADYQYDVWRMAISLVLLADEQPAGTFSSGQIDDILDTFAESYLDTVAGYRGNRDEVGRTFTAANTYGPLDNFLRDVKERESRREMLDEWSSVTDGERRFDLSLSKLAPAPALIAEQITAAMPTYAATTAGDLAEIPGYFDIKDIAERLGAGTGSLGTPRYYVLIEGESADSDDDRILDIKRQGPPSAFIHLSDDEAALLQAAADNPAERTIVGYRALVTGADDHLGWMQLFDGYYSVRERSPFKKAFPTEELTEKAPFIDMAEQWGMILATAHARADKDFRADLIPVSFDKEVDELTDGRHREFRALVRDLARDYAAQVAADYTAFADYVQAQSARAD